MLIVRFRWAWKFFDDWFISGEWAVYGQRGFKFYDTEPVELESGGQCKSRVSVEWRFEPGV